MRSGDVVSPPHYDPMLAKVIAWGGQNRDEARRRLIRALEDTTVFGVTTNRHFLSRIIADDTFGAGEATTPSCSRPSRMIRHWRPPSRSPSASWP